MWKFQKHEQLILRKAIWEMREKEKKFHIERLKRKEEYEWKQHREKIEHEMKEYEDFSNQKQKQLDEARQISDKFAMEK